MRSLYRSWPQLRKHAKPAVVVIVFVTRDETASQPSVVSRAEAKEEFPYLDQSAKSFGLVRSHPA